MNVLDTRFALRSLRRAPLFALASILTLALGIGANTAVFSVVRGVLLRPLPHADGDRLVYLRHSAELAGIENVLFSVPEILDYRAAGALMGIAEFSAMNFTLTRGGEPAQVTAGIVSGNYFEVMGLGAAAGRVFDSGDDGEAAAAAIVLTHDYWMQRLGGDPGVIGETVVLEGRAPTIVGVVQQAPHYPERTDVLVNMVTSPHHLSATMVHGRSHRMTEVFARLAPESTVEQAQTEVDAISVRIHDEYTEAYEAAAGYQLRISPLAEVLTERATQTIYLLWTTAAFVLLIACTTVANLVLTRSARRERELVVRVALGGRASQVRGLLLAESVPLALAGTVLGILVALIAVDLLTTFTARFTPRASEITLDWWVLAFTGGIGSLVAIALAFAPSIPGTALGGGFSLASGGTRMTGSRGFRRLQRGLVVAQVSLSVALLTAGGLLTRTLLNLYDLDIGADLEQVLTVEVPVVGTGRTSAEVRDVYERIRAEIASLPGVAEAAVASSVPLRDNDFELEIVVEDIASDPNLPTPRAAYRTATPEYFRTAGIPVLDGRDFLSTDESDGPLVVILNRALADLLFVGVDAIGRRVAWTGDVLNFIPVSGDWRTVVGIVGDTRSSALDEEPQPAVYQPFAQEEVFAGSLVVRADIDPQALTVPAMQIVRDIDPTAPIGTVGTLLELRDESVASQRINTLLVSGFGLVALLIAAVGLGGVLAFSVSQRTNEIGVRMSLGARPWQVRRMILAEGASLLSVGVILGALASVLAARVVEGLLFGVTPYDPATLTAVVTVMAVVGLTASVLPAIRASNVQPVEALRAD